MFKFKNHRMKKDINEQEELKEEGASEEENKTEEESFEESLEDEFVEEEERDEFGELRGKYLRLVAEFDNYRKRMAKERIALIQTSEKEVVQALLDVLDDADRAEAQMEKTEDVQSVKEGASLIFDKLRKTLKNRGLQEMESVHKEYDPELQEAVAEVPAPTEDLKGKVIDDVQKGYYLNDNIIRHAKVVVGK